MNRTSKLVISYKLKLVPKLASGLETGLVGWLTLTF